VVQDVTDRKLAEARQRLLLDELNHRVKNTLAVVRSIAGQTLRGGRTLAEARDALAERLRALAEAHDLLTGSGWRGAGLRALAEAELGPYAGRASAEGPDLTLGPKAALALGLALHELATNAAKHGALSVPGGRVEVAWGLEGDANERVLRLGWRELGGPPVAATSRHGFGRTLIEQGLRHDLGGEVALEFRPEGLACELRVPASAVLAG
jgi:two-component sensor histidine kinase